MAGLSRALLLRSAFSSSASRLQQQQRTISAAARRAGAAADEEGKQRRPSQQQQKQRQQVQVRLQQRRAFHASRRHDNPILIGLVIVVGATIARYVVRGAVRSSHNVATRDTKAGQ